DPIFVVFDHGVWQRTGERHLQAEVLISDSTEDRAGGGIARLNNLASPGSGVERKAAHGRLHLRRMASVAIRGEDRADLLFEELGAGRLRAQLRSHDRKQQTQTHPPS